MKRSTKALLVTASILIAIGGALAIAGGLNGGVKPIRIGAGGLQVGQSGLIEVDEQFSSLDSVSMDLAVSDIELVPGDSFSLTGAYDQVYGDLTISSSNGHLEVREAKSDWMQWFTMNWPRAGYDAPKLVLTYPASTEFTEFSVDCDLGKVVIDRLEAKTIILDVNAGDLEGTDIKADTLSIDVDAGACSITGLDVSGSADVKVSTGSLSIMKVDVNDLNAKCNVGSITVEGKLTGKTYLKSDVSDASLRLSNRLDKISYSIDCDMGSVFINGRDVGSKDSASNPAAELDLTIDCSMGNVEIDTAG